MKEVCKMGLESIWINHANGAIRMCGWTNYFIGNLVDSSIEELWHGEKAQKFRESMLDGSYRYCDRKRCPYCANHMEDSIMVEYEVPEYPKYCSLSYEDACNYVCRFCRTEKFLSQKNDKCNIEIIEHEIGKFIQQLDVLSSNGVGELFCSPSILRLLSSVKRENEMTVELESNGSLFNEKNWAKIENLGKHDLKVYITVHSFNEDTYQFLSGTSLPVSNIINNLYFIKSLREQGIINYFEIATVVCERNFREMPEFVKKSLEWFEPDKIRLRFFEPYGVRDKAIEWFYDIRNPHHPYYEEFVKVMEHPVFQNSKVWKWQGETLSDLKEHPYFEEQRKVKLLSELAIMENIKAKIEKYLEENQIARFALYGNGQVGQAFASTLEKNAINFGAIFDSYAKGVGENFRGHLVEQPCKKNVSDYSLIIVTSIFYDEIKITLLNLEYKGCVMSLEEFIEKLNRCD